MLYPAISTTPSQLGPPTFYPLIVYQTTVNETRFTHIVLVLSQRSDTLLVRRKEFHSFAFRFNFLSLGLGAFPAGSGLVAMW